MIEVRLFATLREGRGKIVMLPAEDHLMLHPSSAIWIFRLKKSPFYSSTASTKSRITK